MKFIKLGLLLLLLISLPLAVALVKQRQEIRKQAAVSGGAGSVRLDPAAVTKYPGDFFDVAIKFKTGDTEPTAVAIQNLTLKITYPYTGATPELDIVGSDGSPLNQITPNPGLVASGDWSVPIKNVTRANGLVTVEIAAINTSFTGYKSASEVTLTTLRFKANRAAAVTLSLDPTESIMMTKTAPLTDVLKTPVNAVYTLQNDTIPPAAITDLRITGKDKSSLSLSWTAPADTGPEGKAAGYELRYATTGLTANNWSAATLAAGLPTPASRGTGQTFTLNGLIANTTYYLGLKSADKNNNLSVLSNIVSDTIPAATFSFGFTLQGITQVNLIKNFDVTLKSAGQTKTYPSVAFKTDIQGIFKPVNPFSLADFTIASGGTAADIFVKDPSHLAKKLGNFTFTLTDLAAPDTWNSLIVVAGDFNNDNTLNIGDISSLIGHYTALNVPVTAANALYDVDANGTINITDVSLVIGNYTALNVPGDQ
ncbi:MAG: fibronectin type III domain-containing protein [Candidatus Shapirobacteria bacterium]